MKKSNDDDYDEEEEEELVAYETTMSHSYYGGRVRGEYESPPPESVHSGKFTSIAELSPPPLQKKQIAFCDSPPPLQRGSSSSPVMMQHSSSSGGSVGLSSTTSSAHHRGALGGQEYNYNRERTASQEHSLHLTAATAMTNEKKRPPLRNSGVGGGGLIDIVPLPPPKQVMTTVGGGGGEHRRVFIYTGLGEGAIAPKDVVRVRIDPTVLVIPQKAFENRHKLKEVEFHDGLREIGFMAFNNCTALKEVQLSDGIESTEHYVFSCCPVAKFRCPPLLTTITVGMLDGCNNMFSLELSDNTVRVGINACIKCCSLRNVTFAPNTVVDQYAFRYCFDLLQIFGTQEKLENALRKRFSELPLHSKMYYISFYNQITLEDLMDPTGLQQDCLGMTPLHILACSTVQCLELYQLLVEMYPANLIVEDAWGAVPLLYAVWGDAPSEIVTFLVDSYQYLYPNYKFVWNTMVITLGRRDAPTAGIQNLLNVQQTLSPMYNINWDYILGVLAERALVNNKPVASPETFCFLTRCSIATRVNAIGIKHFRDAMADDWTRNKHKFNGQEWRDETITQLEYYESEYQKLKEITSLLELAFWKARLDHDKAKWGGNKKMKVNTSELRLQCRISCGDHHVIENVWPYLLPSDDNVDDESENSCEDRSSPDYIHSHM